MGPVAYHWSVWGRVARDTAAFLKAHVLISLLLAALTAVVIGRVSADVGEAFNVPVAVYAAVVAAVLVAFFAFGRHMMAGPWRMHEELAARLREFERRPKVTKFVQLRERGFELRSEPLKKPMHEGSIRTTNLHGPSAYPAP